MKKHSAEEIEALTRELADELKLAATFGGLRPRADGRTFTKPLPDDQGNLLELAYQGDVDADDRLRLMVRTRLALLMTALEGNECYAELKFSAAENRYLHDLLSRPRTTSIPRKRGRDRTAHLDRNRRIVYFVKWVMKRGYAPTRNRASIDKDGEPSACAIVADALRRRGFSMSERNVEAIWEKRGPERQYPRQGWERDDDDMERAALGILSYVELPEEARERGRAWLRAHADDDPRGNTGPRLRLDEASPKK